MISAANVGIRFANARLQRRSETLHKPSATRNAAAWVPQASVHVHLSFTSTQTDCAIGAVQVPPPPQDIGRKYFCTKDWMKLYNVRSAHFQSPMCSVSWCVMVTPDNAARQEVLASAFDGVHVLAGGKFCLVLENVPFSCSMQKTSPCSGSVPQGYQVFPLLDTA